jgi:hypothetical protein
VGGRPGESGRLTSDRSKWPLLHLRRLLQKQRRVDAPRLEEQYFVFTAFPHPGSGQAEASSDGERVADHTSPNQVTAYVTV